MEPSSRSEGRLKSHPHYDDLLGCGRLDTGWIEVARGRKSYCFGLVAAQLGRWLTAASRNGRGRAARLSPQGDAGSETFRRKHQSCRLFFPAA